MQRTGRTSGVAFAMLLSFVAGVPTAWADERADGRAIVDKLGVQKGICVVLDNTAGKLALALAENSESIVYAQVPTEDARQVICRAAEAAGLLGTRVYVDVGKPASIHLADNLADALVTPAGRTVVPRSEVLRVLRPGGKSLRGQEVMTKPFPAGTDGWSHHYHGPDNNPQTDDRLAGAPYLTQFMVAPRYAPAPQNVVAAAGRVFMAFGHVAWKQRAEPWLDTLVALNGFNGTLLWKRQLTSGVMVDRSTMIATPTRLYLGDRESCKVIDPATGKVTDEITVPAALTGGNQWKWMALAEGMLYALVGEEENLDAVKRWRRTAGGWPWNEISDRYNANDPESFDPGKWQRSPSFDPASYRWGFSKSLLAIDPQTKEILWHHQEQEPIDSRTLCMKNGRIYFSHFGKYLVCLEAKTGKEIWRRTADRDPALFAAIGPYCPYQVAYTGWQSTVYLRCSDEVLYFAGPQVFDVTAVAADDGRHLWTYRAQRNPHVLIRDDAVYIIGANGLNADTHKLDPLSGAVLASYDIARAACTRTTGSADSIFFRGGGDGTIRLDLTSGKTQWISPMRPSCFVGTLVADGHHYWIPWACDCNLQMFGVICCGPAGDFQFDQAAAAAERLETSPGSATPISPLAQSPADWPTYRANNARTATTAAAVPERVGLQWTFTPTAKLVATPPVAVGNLVLFGGSDGSLRALNVADGSPRWSAYTGGAVRYPPSVADGRALVGSGDGYVYAFEASTGRRLWRFRAAPIERKIHVYGTLLSTWPVASGVLVDGGVAYCAAGINNYDGTHVYALDAASGRIKWQNNSAGGVGAAFGAEVSVQGDLLLDDGKLYLAGGNAASPAVFDAVSGERLNAGKKGRRGRELHVSVSANKRGQMERRVEAVGQPLYSTPESPVFERNKQRQWQPATVVAANANLSYRPGPDGWQLVAQDRSTGEELWMQPLPGEPVRWAAVVDAAGHICVALRDGRVLCFASAL